MTELELTRTPHDRRLYSLDGIGAIRIEGLFSNSATAQAGDKTWRLTRRGIWHPTIEATDDIGAFMGQFVPRDIRRGGTLRWAGHELQLRPVSALRERYALRDQATDLAILDGKAGESARSRSHSPTPPPSSPDCCSSQPSSSTASPPTRTPRPPARQQRSRQARELALPRRAERSPFEQMACLSRMLRVATLFRYSVVPLASPEPGQRRGRSRGRFDSSDAPVGRAPTRSGSRSER